MAQTVQDPVGSGFARLEAYAAAPGHALGWAANQAALVQVQSFTASVYGKKRFLLQELSFYQLAVALPLSAGSFGLQVATFGSSGYSKSKTGLAYARSLGKTVQVGVQFNYLHYRMAGYGAAGAVNFEAGALFLLSDQLRAGLQVYNPTRSALGPWENERLPARFTSGLGYEVYKKLLIATEIIKEERLPVTVHTGLQYRIARQLTAKGGFYISTGYRLQLFQLEVAASVHPQLGLTPGLMLTFNKSHE